ncbi:hypothetical protein B0H15DRAFT_954718 [Mycena belliarum]|uniref:Uncharacterized protein n=1 Tax=Mycena belliarum TaxID=1033014 RepID=A0AAD6TXW6_9AGAR|nr:hypothetical protein B0H15DRAFT_954718 [Mycena belliae]
MPKVVSTPVRRPKLDARQRLSRGVRTAASVRAAAIAAQEAEAAAAAASASAPVVKREPVPTPLPVANHRSPRSWRHPDELPYIRTAGKAWHDMTIMRFLCAHAFSIPPRSTRTLDPWVAVRCVDGSEVDLPRGYRLPLLWVARFQWTSLQLVLTADAAIRQREWDNTKFEILHIARLCAVLLEKARLQMEEDGAIERGWRCAQFDRALRRYWYDWLIMRDEFVRDFWREFGEEEFQTDVLKLGWGQWVLKGHKGFTLSKAEVANGITAEQFMAGLVVDENAATFVWDEPATTNLPAPTADASINPAGSTPSPAPIPARHRAKKTEAAVPVVHKPALSAAPPSTPTIVISFRAREYNPFRSSSMQKPVEVAPRPGQSHLPSQRHAREASASQLSASSCKDPSEPTEEMPELWPARATDTASQNQMGSPVEPEVVGKSKIEPHKITPTTMGSLAPGRAVFRGPSTDEMRVDGPDDVDPALVGETRSMSMDVDEVHTKQEIIDTVIPSASADADNFDWDDEDLQLLYREAPESEPPPVDRARSVESSASRAYGRRQSSGTQSQIESGETSRSASPIPPPLSTARFPPTTGTQPELPPAPPTVPAPLSTFTSDPRFSPVSPPSSASVAVPASNTMSVSSYDLERAAEPGLVARFLETFGALGDEMRALRAEVAQIRADLSSPAHPPASPVTSVTLPAARWAHPLQHLIVEDASMDVDAPALEQD